MIAQRVLAVLAAVFLVGSVGLATLGPPDLPLGQMLVMAHAGSMRALEAGTRSYLSPWVWNYVEVPVLARPAWLIPAAIGIVFAGLAFSFAPRRGAPRTRRRG